VTAVCARAAPAVNPIAPSAKPAREINP
jgi:hypothetical protein